MRIFMPKFILQTIKAKMVGLRIIYPLFSILSSTVALYNALDDRDSDFEHIYIDTVDLCSINFQKVLILVQLFLLASHGHVRP